MFRSNSLFMRQTTIGSYTLYAWSTQSYFHIQLIQQSRTEEIRLNILNDWNLVCCFFFQIYSLSKKITRLPLVCREQIYPEDNRQNVAAAAQRLWVYKEETACLNHPYRAKKQIEAKSNPYLVFIYKKIKRWRWVKNGMARDAW